MIRYALKNDSKGKNMNKMLGIVLILLVFLVMGCTEKNITKDKMVNEVSKNKDKYDLVITKSINDCKEHNITLNEERTNDFMRRSPQSIIDKTAADTRKIPKKLCQFFADETSLEKIEHIDAFTSKIMSSCKEVGVTLAKEKIHNKITNLPFFVIKKGLEMKNKTTAQKCKLMQKKYQ